jgi:carnosine N-methyltransferase
MDTRPEQTLSARGAEPCATDPLSGLCCPLCHSTLQCDAGQLVCTGCGRRYPWCNARVSLLLAEEADLAQAAARTGISRELAKLDRMRKSLESARWFPAEREAVRLEMLRGVVVNSGTLATLARQLARPSMEEQVVEPETYQTASVVMSYVLRDWANEAVSEQQVAAIESAVARALPANLESVAVLGAGACRVANDLTGVFEHVLAFDKSPTMLVAYDLLRRSSLEWFVISPANCETPEQQVRSVVVSAETRRLGIFGTPRPERLTLAVADATELPIATQSMSAVVSIFFTDVVPLSTLLPEIKRVLRVGGHFIHFGPLGYHFKEEMHGLSLREVRSAFVRAGFDSVVDNFVPLVHTYGPAGPPSNLVHTSFRNWLFSARRLPDLPIPASSVLAINPGGVIEKRIVFGDGGRREESLKLVGPSGVELETSNDSLVVIDAIDGVSTLEGISDRIARATSKTFAAESLQEFIKELIMAEFVRTVED